jgi:hypothetical protein
MESFLTMKGRSKAVCHGDTKEERSSGEVLTRTYNVVKEGSTNISLFPL